jgi:hypothetical protein
MDGLVACYELSIHESRQSIEVTKSPKHSSSLSKDESSIVLCSKESPTSSNDDVIMHKSKKQHCKKVYSSTTAHK